MKAKALKDLCYEALHRCYNLFPHKDGIVIHFSHILCEKSVERLTVQLMFPSLSVAAGQPSSHKRDATFPTKFHRSADVNDMRKDKPTRCTHTRAHLFHLPKPAARQFIVKVFPASHDFTIFNLLIKGRARVGWCSLMTSVELFLPLLISIKGPHIIIPVWELFKPTKLRLKIKRELWCFSKNVNH